MNSTLIGLVAVFRHGQRPPYPPPFATSWADAAAIGWTNRSQGFDDMTPARWNMSSEKAFEDQELNGHGFKLPSLGERNLLMSPIPD